MCAYLVIHIADICSRYVASGSLSSWDLLLEVLNLNVAKFIIIFSFLVCTLVFCLRNFCHPEVLKIFLYNALKIFEFCLLYLTLVSTRI